MIPDAAALENIKRSTLPIFFIPLGEHVNLFIDRVLKQAVASNGHNNVYVLTDTNFHLYQAYNCIDVSKYMQGRSFDALYIHHSENKYHFEKSCFDRWFIINDVAKDLGISHFFHADCDVLIMQDLKPFFAEYLQDRYDGSVMYFEDGDRSITSGHSSFWTGALLNKFCDFTCAKYSDEQAFDKILKDVKAGVFCDNFNVSDMILLDTFRRETQTKTLNLFTLEDKGICFDFNINVAANGNKQIFVMNPLYRIKHIVHKNGTSYGQAKGGGRYPFYTLHFQGYISKALIPMHITYGTKYQRMQNWVIGARHFTVRKLKLAKNKVRDTLKGLVK